MQRPRMKAAIRVSKVREALGEVDDKEHKILTRVISLSDIFDASAVAGVLRRCRGHGLGSIGFE